MIRAIIIGAAELASLALFIGGMSMTLYVMCT